MNMSTVIMAMGKAVAAMESMAAMNTIMAMGKAVAAMESMVTMTIIMRTRFSQAGAGKQRINIRTRSLISC